MKKIKLTQGKVALVDDADFEHLSGFKWYAGKGHHSFYARRSHRGRGIMMHRVILGLTDSDVFADHIDHNGLNNQRGNLRVVTPSENTLNVTSAKNSSSKYLGVCWAKRYRKWKAQIKKNGVTINLGLFDSEDEAAFAYDQAAIIYHGEFANLNNVICGN